MTHICVGNLTIIGSDIGLSPDRRKAIILTNVAIVLIGPLGTNFIETLFEIHTFSLKNIHLKMSSGNLAAILFRPQCVLYMSVLGAFHENTTKTADLLQLTIDNQYMKHG